MFTVQEYPVTLTQFLFYLYHNVHEFMPVFMGPNVLTALAGTMFPMVTNSNPATAASSPEGSPVKEIGKERPIVLSLPAQV